LNKYKEEQDGCNWYASGHTKNCISVDKNGTGLSQLWRQMLSQFPLCTLEISEAISSVYTSPITLLKVSKTNFDVKKIFHLNVFDIHYF
jgi:hypothetical protein